MNFDVGAFGASGGGRARLIPNGARVTTSIVKVRTDQGVLPWVVRVESGGTVVFDLTPEERRQEWLDATEFIAVMESVLAFIPALLIFGSVRRRSLGLGASVGYAAHICLTPVDGPTCGLGASTEGAPATSGRSRRSAQELPRLLPPLAGTFHGHLGLQEAKLLVERGHAGSTSPEHPGHAVVVAHGCLDQGGTDASPAALACHDNHRDVAIEDAIRNRTKEADDHVVLDRRQRDMGARNQLPEELRIFKRVAPSRSPPIAGAPVRTLRAESS